MSNSNGLGHSSTASLTKKEQKISNSVCKALPFHTVSYV